MPDGLRDRLKKQGLRERLRSQEAAASSAPVVAPAPPLDNTQRTSRLDEIGASWLQTPLAASSPAPAATRPPFDLNPRPPAGMTAGFNPYATEEIGGTVNQHNKGNAMANTVFDTVSPVGEVLVNFPINTGIAINERIMRAATGNPDARLSRLPPLNSLSTPPTSRGEAAARAAGRLGGTVASFVVPSGPLKAAKIGGRLASGLFTRPSLRLAAGLTGGVGGFSGAMRVPDLISGDQAPLDYAKETATAGAHLAKDIATMPFNLAAQAKTDGGLFGTPESVLNTGRTIEPLAAIALAGRLAREINPAGHRSSNNGRQRQTQEQQRSGRQEAPQPAPQERQVNPQPLEEGRQEGRQEGQRLTPTPPAPFRRLAVPGYAESLITRVERQGGLVGRFAGKLAKKAVASSNEVMGSVANAKLAFENKLRSVPLMKLISPKAREYSNARTGLAEPVFDGDAGFSRMQVLVEGRSEFSPFMGARTRSRLGGVETEFKSPAEREAVSDYNGIVQRVFNEARKRGVELVTKAGKVIDVDLNADVFKFRRAPSLELQDSFRRRDTTYRKLVSELQRLNDLKATEVEQSLNEMLAPDSIRNTGVEITRAFKLFPTHLKVTENGKTRVVKILESDPVHALDSAIRNDADRIGFASQFGQEVKGRAIGERTPFADRLRLKFVERGGDEVALNDLYGALNNRPLREAGITTPLVAARSRKLGGIRDYVRRAINMGDKAAETAMVSLAAVPNAVEQIAKLPSYGGTTRWLRAALDVAKNPRERRAELREIGAITTSLLDFHIEKGRRIEDVTKVASDVARKGVLLDPVNEWNETVAANVGRIMASDLKARRGDFRDAERLRTMEFTDAEIRSLTEGTAPQSLYNEIPRRMAEKTQGSTSRKAQKSLAGNSRLFSRVFRFNNYFQLSMRSNARVTENFVDAVRSGNPKRIAAAGAVAAEYLAGSTAAGAGQMYLVALLTGRDTDRSDESWPQWIGKNLLATTVGGPLLTIATSLGEDQSIGETLVNTSPHLRVLEQARRLMFGDGRFSEMTPSERTLEFIKTVTPLTRTQKGYMTMIGLHDPAIETANTKYWAWHVENKGKPGDRISDDRFRLHMRRAYEALRNGRVEETNGEISLAIAESSRPGRDISDARAILLSRRKLAPLSGSEIDSLRRTIGQKHFEALQREESLLNNFAWMNNVAAEYYRNVATLRRRKRDGTITPDEDAILRSLDKYKRKLSALRQAHDNAETEKERADINKSIQEVMASVNSAFRGRIAEDSDNDSTR